MSTDSKRSDHANHGNHPDGQKPEHKGLEFHMIQGRETTYRYETGLHILFGLGGRSTVYIGESAWPLEEEGVIAINPCTLYRVQSLDGSLILLSVPESTLRSCGRKANAVYSCYARDAGGVQTDLSLVREHLAVLLYEYLQNHQRISSRAADRLQRLLKVLEEHAGLQAGGRVARPDAGEKAEQLIRYLDRHWDEDLTLTSLADRVHFSVSYLSRFFQKTVGMRFSAYLRSLRMIHARNLLLSGDLSVTQIAYDCGFHNAGVFIESFKQEYQMTPGQFRRQWKEQAASGSSRTQSGNRAHDQRSDFSVLLSHIPEKKSDEIPVRRETVEIDCSDVKETAPAKTDSMKTGFVERDANRNPGMPLFTRLLNIGYARDGLAAPVQDQMRRAQAEIGFTYFRCHGLLDEDMHVYHEDADGSLSFSFVYVDALFDYVISLGLRPFIELSFMPPELAVRPTRIFDRPSLIAGCRDLSKWASLIRALLGHLADRYGRKALHSWRFATISLSYVRIGCLTPDEFADLYETTWRTVKSFDPDIPFGGAGYFPDLIENDEIGVPWFLRLAAERGCLPDFHSMQWYPCIQTDDSLFLEYTMNQNAAPALLSRDPDYLRERLDALDRLFSIYKVEDRELFLEECNSTLWQRDLSGDTTYKAVWLAKNMHLSAGRAVFGYWLLTDYMEERANIQSIFHGGYGLFTFNGIPKAGYQGMKMISMLGREIVSEGKGWIMTRRDHVTWTMLIYNYSHYSDLNCYRYKQLETPADAYTVFRPGEVMQLQFSLKGLPAGRCEVTRRRLSREHGSSFDQWIRLRAPAYPDLRQTEWLMDHSEPSAGMEMAELTDDMDALQLASELLPLEMELITIRSLLKA